MLSSRKITIAILLVLSSFTSYGLDDPLPVGARAAGMSSASVAHADIWSIYNNQAGLSKVENFTLALYNDNKFIKELGTKSIVFGLPTNSGTFGISISSTGIPDASFQKFGIAYGKGLGEKFSAGLQLEYLRISQPSNYGTDGAFTFEMGIISNPVQSLFIGFHVFNPIRAKYLRQDDERIYTLIKGGIEYHFVDKAIIAVETEKDLEFAPNYKIGCEYNFYKNLDLRLGISTNPVNYSFGLGFKVNNILAHVAFTLHNELGLIPHISFSYAF